MSAQSTLVEALRELCTSLLADYGESGGLNKASRKRALEIARECLALALAAHDAQPSDRETNGALKAAAYTMLQFARDPNLAGCTTGFGVYMRRDRAVEISGEIITRALKSQTGDGT